MRRVIVHIDRLVLKGFRHQDREGIATEMQREMERMFADPQALSQLQSIGNVASLKVNPVPIERSSMPQDVGRAVAQGIGQAVGK